MRDKYYVIEVRIKLDPIPGWGHEAEDHVKFLQYYLKGIVPHYNPQVKLLKVEAEKGG